MVCLMSGVCLVGVGMFEGGGGGLFGACSTDRLSYRKNSVFFLPFSLSSHSLSTSQSSSSNSNSTAPSNSTLPTSFPINPTFNSSSISTPPPLPQTDRVLGENSLKIVSLLSGQVELRGSRSINCCQHLDWKRTFGMHLWWVGEWGI